MRPSAARPVESSRPRRRPVWRRALALLGLAALGALVALLGRRRPRSQPPRPARGPQGDSPRGASAPPGARRDGWVAGPAGSLFFRQVEGRGTPVVFVHGLAGRAAHWEGQLRWLVEQGRSGVAPELRGHGESDPPVGPDYEIEDYASDVLAVVDALGYRRFLLAGHSLGGQVAIEVAGRHPERVAGLLLVDPSGDASDTPREERDELVAAVAADPLGEFELHYRQFLAGGRAVTKEQVLSDLEQTPPEVLAPSLAASMSYPAATALRRYPGPVLCLVTPLNELPSSLPHRVPELGSRRVGETSHWLMLDAPAAVIGALQDLGHRTALV